VETVRSEISSLNDQLKSASKRLASIDAIFRNKFTLFLQVGPYYYHVVSHCFAYFHVNSKMLIIVTNSKCYFDQVNNT